VRKFVNYSLLVITLALGACGFTPMYEENRKLQDKMLEIYIAPIEGTDGIDLRNHLVSKWNTNNSPDTKYKLVVKLNKPATVYKALQRSGDATWEEVRMTASWTLSEKSKIITKSSESASESYTFVTDLVSANASKNSAIQNAIKIISDNIELKVNAKLKNEN
jgi:hypothetical protein